MKRTLLSVLSALFLVITFVGCQDASGPMSSVDKGITDDYLSKTYGGDTASVTQPEEAAPQDVSALSISYQKWSSASSSFVEASRQEIESLSLLRSD